MSSSIIRSDEERLLSVGSDVRGARGRDWSVPFTPG